MELASFHVDDWAEFIEREDIDLSCPACKGTGEARDDDDGAECCEDCSGTGHIEVMWNTIWNTGFHSLPGMELPTEFGCVFAFDWQDQVWFGLSTCGMDCTPYLAAAWLEAFPDCDWLPETFMVRGLNLTHGYIESVVGKDTAKKIYAVMQKSAGQLENSVKELRRELRQARAHLAKKAG